MRIDAATSSTNPIVRLAGRNPLRNQGSLLLYLPRLSHVHVGVFDVAGRLVRTLIDRDMVPGSHEIPWDGRDEMGRELPAGLYLAQLRAGGRHVNHKVVLLH